MFRPLVVIAVFVSALFAAGTPVNEVENGGFESGIDEWVASAGASVITAGANSMEGDAVLELEALSETVSGSVLQRLTLETDREYEISFFYQRSFEDDEQRLPVTLDGYDSYRVITRPRLDETNLEHFTPEAASWTELTARFFARGEKGTLQIGPVTYTSNPVVGGKVWLDDVRVTALDTFREVGVDHDYNAVLPSDGVVGEPVELHLAGIDTRDNQGGFRVRETPVPTRARIDLLPSDPSTFVPMDVEFHGELFQRVPVTFQTPGVHRIRLTHANGHTTLSNPIKVALTPPAERRYWGDVHIHTKYNHGGWVAGDGFQNLWYARDIAGLDFATLTEHSPAKSSLPYIHQMSDATESFYDPGEFTTFFGAEGGTFEGHHNTYLRTDDRFALSDFRYQDFEHQEEKLDFYRAQGTQFLNVPHHFSLLQPVDFRRRDRQAQTLVEVYSEHGSSEIAGEWWRHPDHNGNNYEASMGARGHDYPAALGRGLRLGLMGSSDNHRGRPGFTGLTCVSAPSNERGAIWDELQERSCYATTGPRILVSTSIEGTPMGGEVFLAQGTPITLELDVNATDSISSIEVVVDGEVVHTLQPQVLDFEDGVDLPAFQGETRYYYIRVFQADGHRAWSSPIWVSPVATPDLAVERKDIVFNASRAKLTVRPQNYGDAPGTADVKVYSSQGHSALADFDLEGLDLGVVARVEPFDEDRSMVYFHLFTPGQFNEVFDFSGSIQLSGHVGYTIVADPREMLVVHPGGLVTWDDGPYGYKFSGSASHSGQISDFSLLVGTDELTTLTATFEKDGVPIAFCYLGDTLSAVPGQIDIPLGTIAAASFVGEATVTVPAQGALTPALPVEFTGLAPGYTYVAVIDPDDAVAEFEERNNSSARAVPALEPTYTQWPDIPNPPPLPEIRIDPATAGMAIGTDLELRATALYPDGNEADVSSIVTWVPDEDFDEFLTLHPDGRLESKGSELAARVHANMTLGQQVSRSNDAVVWATDRPNPSVLMAGYGVSFLDEGNPEQALVVNARVAQRDDFADGTVQVFLTNQDSSIWLPYGDPVELLDNGLDADAAAGDGVFTVRLQPGPQADATQFKVGDNLKSIRALYTVDGALLFDEQPWPFFSPGDGSGSILAGPALSSPPEETTLLGPRIISAGSRGFGGALEPTPTLRPIVVSGEQLLGQLTHEGRLFLEVEIQRATYSILAGAPHRVIAHLPWSPGTEIELTPSPDSDSLFRLDVPFPHSVDADQLQLIELRAEAYFYLDLGDEVVEWWSSDIWPRLRLHDFLAD